jgi:hypothetical protein
MGLCCYSNDRIGCGRSAHRLAGKIPSIAAALDCEVDALSTTHGGHKIEPG